MMEVIWEPELSTAQMVQNLESSSIHILQDIKIHNIDLPKREGRNACKVGGDKTRTHFFCKLCLNNLTVPLEMYGLCVTDI